MRSSAGGRILFTAVVLLMIIADGASAAPAGPAAGAADIENGLQELFGRLDLLAVSRKLTSSEYEAVDSIFMETIASNTAIQSLLRTNSNGLVINERGRGMAPVSMRSVFDQQWFTRVSERRMPYRGTARDSSGMLCLFWVWPIMIDATDTTGIRFGGTFAAKIDVSGLFASLLESNTTPLQVRYNGTTLYSHRWRTADKTAEGPIQVGDLEGLTVRYAVPSAAHRRQQAGPDDDTALTADAESASGLAGGHGTERGFVIALVATLTGVAVVSSLLLRRKLKGSSRKSYVPDQEAFASLLPDTAVGMGSGGSRDQAAQIEPAEPEQAQAADQSAGAPDTEACSDQLPPSAEVPMPAEEEETKEIHLDTAADVYERLRSLVYDGAKAHFKKVDPAFENDRDLLRQEVYREVHSEISYWVVCELSRLSGQLERLAARIRKVESSGSVVAKGTLGKEAQQIAASIRTLHKRINGASGEQS